MGWGVEGISGGGGSSALVGITGRHQASLGKLDQEMHAARLLPAGPILYLRMQ